MATKAQVVANRRNAEKSTGPHTPEGKAAVSQNAVKHGLLAGHDVIRGEDREEFELYREELFWELNPLGTMECRLAERIVSLAWRLRRAERLQNEAFDALLARNMSSPLDRLTQSLLCKGADQPDDAKGCDGDLTLGRTVVRDFANARVLDRLLMYERRIESSLYRTMAELQKLRRAEKPEAHNGRSGCRTRRDAKDDTRIAATGGHSPPCEIDRAEQSQILPMDGGHSPPCESGGASPGEETPYGVTTSGGDSAKQSQSPPGDGVHGTPYERADTGHGEGTPKGVTPNGGDCAKQSQSAGGAEARVGTASLVSYPRGCEEAGLLIPVKRSGVGDSRGILEGAAGSPKFGKEGAANERW